MTSLMYAVANNFTDITQFLMDVGADIDETDENKFSVLMYAAY